MTQQIRAIVVDPTVPEKLAIKPVELRDPDRDEVGVRVTAISLNRGETRRALQVAEPGWRPGWDFAGAVETAAANGSGPKPGTRVSRSSSAAPSTSTSATSPRAELATSAKVRGAGLGEAAVGLQSASGRALSHPGSG